MGVKSVLVVEDDGPLAATLGAFAQSRADNVRVVHTTREARRVLAGGAIDVAVIDLALPDGSGLELLPALWGQAVMPRVIVISGSATPEIAFRLAQNGVRTFVAKPVGLADLERAWRDALGAVPDVRPFVRASVGMVTLAEMEENVRASMTEEALARARDNRRGASRLLGISRQVLQYILRRNGSRSSSAQE
jgi:DNA-binding NtrC family response regulator